MGAISVTASDFVGQYQLARTTASDVILNSYITREYTKTLYKLLGKELADLLIAYNALTQTTTTSGSLVIGTSYYITDFNTGDDFTNVGASSNATGVYFVATGTTPTTWTNLSSLKSNMIERYENIINSFYITDDVYFWNNVAHESTGIKDLLLMSIYYAYVSETQLKQTQSGVSFSDSENSVVQSGANAYRLVEQKWNNAGLTTWWAIRWYCYIKYPSVYPEYAGICERTRYSGLM